MARRVPTGCTHLVSQSERIWFGGRDGQCVPLISATGAATDGPDAPGHDGWGMSAAPAMALICLTGAEMCECRRDKPGHDDRGRILLRPPPYPEPYGDTPGHDGEARAPAPPPPPATPLMLIRTERTVSDWRSGGRPGPSGDTRRRGRLVSVYGRRRPGAAWPGDGCGSQ